MALNLHYQMLPKEVATVKGKLIGNDLDPEGDYVHPMLNAIAMTTVIMGWGDLKTEATAWEFFERVRLYETWFGEALYIKSDGTSVFTWESIKPFIGVWTNVLPERRKTWERRMHKIHERELKEAFIKKMHEEAAHR